MQLINPSTSSNELNTTLTPHSITHGDACFAYFNKIWGIPPPAIGVGARLLDTWFATAGCLRRTYQCEGGLGPVCCLNKRPTQPVEGGMTEGGLSFGVPGI